MATNVNKPVGPRVIPIGNTVVDMQTPVILSTSTAYTSGDAVGGLLTFNAVDDQAKTGVLANVMIVDYSKQSANLELHLFSSSFAPSTDNAAWAPSTADMAKWIGHVSVSSVDYVTSSSFTAATKTGVGLVIAPDSTTLYGQLVVRTSTPTYLSTSPVVIKVKVLSD